MRSAFFTLSANVVSAGLLFLGASCFLSVSAHAAKPPAAPFANLSPPLSSTRPTVTLAPVIITDQLERPWSLAFLPNGDFLVTERTGQLRRVTPSGEISPPIQGLPPIAIIGQGGLLDVALHPQFSENRWVYLSFTAGSAVKGYSTEVIRGKLINNRLSDVETLFVALPKTKGGRHFGGRLLLHTAHDQPQPYLYISLGDRGVKSLAQQLDSHHGSLIRLYDDGRIPADNPFIGNTNTTVIRTSKARPEIFTYGHRNSQGLAVHPQTNNIWLHEHGPQGGDELNRIDAGRSYIHSVHSANYGWPVITYGVNYGIATKIGEGTHKAGMEQPQYMWTPSIAPSGLAFYNNQWLVGSLKFQLLAVLTPLDIASQQEASKGENASLTQYFSENRYFSKQFGRIRDVRVGVGINSDKLYLLTDSDQGKLIQLPANFQE
ncbi:MAG: glucose/arabinose dehydrogenase [Candidatus Endobugula sp.]|jgi:glucose/arabinose dehydrogenase